MMATQQRDYPLEVDDRADARSSIRLPIPDAKLKSKARDHVGDAARRR
jgi:hypothetical protein